MSHPVHDDSDRLVAAQASPDFVQLKKRFRAFAFPMTAAFFLWYALYVLLSAYARDFMSIKLVGNINVALVLGLLQFVSTFLIAWIYARYAERQLDPTADAHAGRDRGSGDFAMNGSSSRPTSAATPPVR